MAPIQLQGTGFFLTVMRSPRRCGIGSCWVCSPRAARSWVRRGIHGSGWKGMVRKEWQYGVWRCFENTNLNPACWRAESSTPFCLTRQGWPELKMSQMRRLLLRTIRKLSISDCPRWKEQGLNSKKKGTGLCQLQRMVVLYLMYIVCLKLWDWSSFSQLKWQFWGITRYITVYQYITIYCIPHCHTHISTQWSLSI